jgi:hypothetical protein
MKNFLLLSIVMISLSISQCRNDGRRNAPASAAGDTGKARIVFREYEHSFGKVAEGEKVSYIFKFDNTGTADLVIASALTTCGCTVPEYDTRPIAPGRSGNLEVVFDTSGKDGMQTKTITVKSNAEKPVVILKITAEVIPDNR